MSGKGKNKFKAISAATAAVVNVVEIRSREEKHKFKVVFRNEVTDLAPVNIYWISHQGKEILKRENLAIREEYSTNTYFSHPWIFRKSPSDGRKLIASGNHVQSVIFEGILFLAKPNDKIIVVISDGKPGFISFKKQIFSSKTPYHISYNNLTFTVSICRG